MTEIFSQKPQTPIRRKLRSNMTKSEAVLWKRINNRQVADCKFRRQCGIGPFIVDFYCPELKLIVEVDGMTHDDIEVIKKDEQKEQYFKNLKLNIKRYTAHDIFKFTREVLDDLYYACLELKSKR